MTTTIEQTPFRCELSLTQRDLLARLDDLTPRQLRDVLCYLVGGCPDVTGRAFDSVQAHPVGAR